MQRPIFDKSIKPFLFATMMAAALVAGTPSTAGASGFTVVTPSNLDGWQPANVRADATVGITTNQPRTGSGSLEFNTNTITSGQDKADYVKYWGVVPGRTLGNLSTLSYEFYRAGSSTNAAHLAPAFRLAYQNASGQTGYLIWEPVYNGYPASVPVDQWVSANIFSGFFWMRAFGPGRTIDNYGIPLAGWIANNDNGGPILDPVDNDTNHVLDANTSIIGIEVGVGSGWGGQFRGFVDNVQVTFGADEVTANFESNPPCTTVCYVDATNGSDSNTGVSIATAFKTIQKAIDTVQAGGTVRVLPGNYSETAADRTLTTGGTYQFGLFFPDAKPGISVIGVDASDNPITTYAGVLATVNTNATNGFGPSGIFVEADNITLQGLRIGTNSAGQNKTIEVIGDGFTLKNSEINDPDGSVYINDFRFDAGANTSRVKRYTIDGNRFVDGVSLDLASGAGFSGPVTDRQVVNNKFEMGTGDYWPAIGFSGSGTGVEWYVYSVGGAVITGNTFSGGEQYIRARGAYDNTQFDWASYWNGNTYDKAVVALVTQSPFDVRSFTYTTTNPSNPSNPYTFNTTRRIGAVIQPEVDNAQAGDTVLVKAGTYSEQVTVTKSLLLKGESGASTTFIKAPATLPIASNPDSTIVKIAGAGVNAELTGFTVAGPGPGPSNCGSILAGIFVRDGANANIHDNSVLDIRDSEAGGDAPFSGCQNGVGIIVGRQQIPTTGTATIKNNTIAGYQKNGIVVSNAGSNALIDGNTVSGFGAQSKIAQNGVQVSAGAVATVQNNTIKDHLCNHASCGPDPINQTQSGGVLLIGAGNGTVVKNNTVQNNDMGVYANSAQVDVKENFITANRYAGVFVDEGKANVTDNEITGASNLGVVIVSFEGAGANSEATLTNNLIKDAVEGVKLIDQITSDTALPVLTASLNSIAGSTNGLNNTSTNPANAEKNWWGNASGPTNAGNPGGTGAVVAGNVDYDPWLCDGTDTSPSIGFQPNPNTLCSVPGSIALTKVVNWDGAAVNNAQTFQLCVSGGALASPICQNFGANGGTQNVSGLQPGNYTVTETDPGSAWTVIGNNATVVVASNVSASSTITNQLKRGSIDITKVVNWSGVAVNNGQSFSICLSGPSFSSPDCKSFGANGGTQTWSSVIAGNYTVNEGGLGANWSVSGNNANVVLAAGDTANATITNTFRAASLKVTKAVDWSGTPPTAATFQICITGPSYSTLNCKTFTAGQDQTWSPLIPGNYVVYETNPGANWNVSGTGTVVVAAGSNASATVTNTFLAASLTVTKTVNWNGAPAASAATFQICVTGPSFSTPACKSFGANGGVQTWSPLIPGNYTVVETNPGANWTVTGNNAVVNVAPAQAATARIINVLRPGTLQVVKVVNTNGATGLSQTFSICVTGPSFTAPDCKTVGVAGGTLQWGPVVPGNYSVIETAPGGNWTVSGNNATVMVNPAQTGSTTITNTYFDASFACSVLDNFNRSNGKLGSNWAGKTDDYKVKDNVAYLNDGDGDIILWNRTPATFGANQYACLTLTKIATNSEKHALILKAQGTDARAGMIKVAYVPKSKRVDVWSIQPGQGWVKRATINNVTFANGDKFGARAYADGSVRVYKNGALIGTSQTSSYFVNRSGRIGVWFLNAEGARFDDFGGGNFTP